jgi:transcriptional regulator
VYVPTAFEMDERELEELLLHHGAGDLITSGSSGLLATLIPFVFDASVGEHGVLRGHLARNNEQWQVPAEGETLVIIRGPDSYVSPSWYASKQEHGRVVPTWNYVTVHVYGELRVHDDIEFVRGVVHELTSKHEATREPPWQVADAPAAFIEGQLRAIVGVELVITRVQAKAKLSQNRPAADVDGVITGLRESGEHGMAQQVEDHRPPPN